MTTAYMYKAGLSGEQRQWLPIKRAWSGNYIIKEFLKSGGPHAFFCMHIDKNSQQPTIKTEVL